MKSGQPSGHTDLGLILNLLRVKGKEKGYQWRTQSKTAHPLQSATLIFLNYLGSHFPSTADSAGKGQITFPMFHVPIRKSPLPESPQRGLLPLLCSSITLLPILISL